MRAMLRATAAGVGMSYESCSRDYSQTNYSSSRLALLEDRENWKAIQRYLIENFHQPVFEAWLEMAVMGGKLNLPTYETQPERYKRVKWCPRAWGWIDPQKEVAAYKEAVRCGFKTQAQVVAEQGGDINELMAERQAELELVDELGIALDTDPRSEQVSALPEPPLAEVEDSVAEETEELIEDEG